jgi:hypothetical protein
MKKRATDWLVRKVLEGMWPQQFVVVLIGENGAGWVADSV